jgi:hypothetical protein
VRHALAVSLLGILFTLAACSPVSVAGAAGVPEGRYTCYQYSYPTGYLYFGAIDFKSGGQYAPIDAKGGHYTMTSAGAITFDEGNYKDNGWKAQFHKADGKDFKNDEVVLDPDQLKIACNK